MSGGDLAAVIVAIASIAAVGVLGVALWSVHSTLRAVRSGLDELRTETMPLLAELRRTTERADADLDRAEEVLGAAERVSGTIESLSKVIYLAVSNPVIKVVAFLGGVGRALRRARSRS